MATLNIQIGLNSADIQDAIRQLENYRDDLERKGNLICARLADYGARRVDIRFATAYYDGINDVDITVDETDGGYVITASGEAVLFIEFGSGVRYGYGHPDVHGYGPGTYPGKGHWDDPNGWSIPKDKGGGHTYGNPPAAAMYLTGQELKDEVERVAREVFSS